MLTANQQTTRVDRNAPAPQQRPRRWWKNALWAVGGLLCGILLAVVGLIYLAPQPTTAKQVSAASTGAATLTVDDAFLTSVGSAAIAQAGLPFSVSHLQAHIAANDMIALSGDATLLPGTPTRRLAVTAQLSVANGAPAARILSATVGGLPLPAAVDDALASALDSKISDVANSLKIGSARYLLTGITSTDGSLTLAFAPAAKP